MKHCCFIAILFCFFGCTLSVNELNDLKTENFILQQRVDSLVNELEDLKFGSKNLLEGAKEKISVKDFVVAKSLLDSLINKYPTSLEFNSAKSLLKSTAAKAEDQIFTVASKSEDIESLRSYINEYPKGKYLAKARKFIKQYERKQTQNSQSIYVSSSRKTYKAKRSYESNVRVGAVCCDGTRSYSTGRGTCSHHGGVCEWLYQ